MPYLDTPGGRKAHASILLFTSMGKAVTYDTDHICQFFRPLIILPCLRYIGDYATEFDGWLKQLSTAREIAQAVIKRLS